MYNISIKKILDSPYPINEDLTKWIKMVETINYAHENIDD